MAAGFDEGKRGGGKSFCFVVVEIELIFCHPCFNVNCTCTELFGEVVYFTERGGFLELRVICEKLMTYRMASKDVKERCGVQTTGASTLFTADCHVPTLTSQLPCAHTN